MRRASMPRHLRNTKDALKLIRENVKTVGRDIRVLQADAISYLRACGKYDLIFVDPPYDSDLAAQVVKSVKEFDILSDGGIMICETRSETDLPEPGAPYVKRKEYRYGKVKLTTFAKET